jgi:hypothetical protein
VACVGPENLVIAAGTLEAARWYICLLLVCLWQETERTLAADAETANELRFAHPEAVPLLLHEVSSDSDRSTAGGGSDSVASLRKRWTHSTQSSGSANDTAAGVDSPRSVGSTRSTDSPRSVGSTRSTDSPRSIHSPRSAGGRSSSGDDDTRLPGAQSTTGSRLLWSISSLTGIRGCFGRDVNADDVLREVRPANEICPENLAWLEPRILFVAAKIWTSSVSYSASNGGSNCVPLVSRMLHL